MKSRTPLASNRVDGNGTKSRKNTKKRDDDAYHPGNPNGRKRPFDKDGASTTNIFTMRTDTRDEFTTPDGKSQRVVTSVLIYPQAFPAEVDLAEAEDSLVAALTKTPHYRPVTVTALSDALSPLKAETPDGKTPLNRVAKLGPLSLFSNLPLPFSPSKMPEKNTPVPSTFFSTPAYHAVKPPTTPIKTQTLQISSAYLRLRDKIKQFRRSISQQQVMANVGVPSSCASATQYVDAAKLFPPEKGVRCEWLHLLAYDLWGDDSQIEGNLVAGTSAANTSQLMLEVEVRPLAKLYPNGLQLEVVAEMKANTQLANTITWKLTTPDFSVSFDFDAQNPHKPHISFRDYVHTFFKTLTLLAAKKAPLGNITNVVLNTPSILQRPSPLFAKPVVGQKRSAENGNPPAKCL